MPQDNRWHDCFLPEDYWRRARHEYAEAAARGPCDLDAFAVRVPGGVIRRMDDISELLRPQDPTHDEQGRI